MSDAALNEGAPDRFGDLGVKAVAFGFGQDLIHHIFDAGLIAYRAPVAFDTGRRPRYRLAVRPKASREPGPTGRSRGGHRPWPDTLQGSSGGDLGRDRWFCSQYPWAPGLLWFALLVKYKDKAENV